MNQAVLQLRDGPRQQIVKRPRCLKVEAFKLTPEGNKVESRRDRATGDALIGALQRPRQEIVPTFAVFARRKQSRGACGLLAMVIQVFRTAAASSA